jgi:large subunit ribosomal protein L3
LVDTDKNVLLVKGNVPGARRGFVVIKTTVKPVKSVPARDILVRTAKVEEVKED